VKISSAELFTLGVVGLALGVNPDTRPSETRLEALDSHDGEEEPEEADKECDMNEIGSGTFKTSKNYLIWSVREFSNKVL
jgi:hypothetical protein